MDKNDKLANLQRRICRLVLRLIRAQMSLLMRIPATSRTERDRRCIVYAAVDDLINAS